MSRLPDTLGALRSTGYRPRTVRDKLRSNLLARLDRKERLFPGVIGYDDTVLPAIVNAVLARHDFILLGLRGQAKSRILRALSTLLAWRRWRDPTWTSGRMRTTLGWQPES